LINRRHYLPRLPLTLSSFEKNDQLTLTGHYISLPDRRRRTRNPQGAANHGFLVPVAVLPGTLRLWPPAKCEKWRAKRSRVYSLVAGKAKWKSQRY